MKLFLGFATCVLAAVTLFLTTGSALQQTPQSNSRGEYIVHHVAMCIMCHTPKDSNGNLIENQLLEGAPIPVKSPYANEEWATRAPRIRGLGGFPEADVIHLLTTGSRRNQPAPKRPMPPFRMTEEDARAVVAYLKSLR